MRTPRTRWLALSLAALAAVVAVACTEAEHDPQGAGPSCKTDCGSGAVGGSGSPKDAGAAGDAGAADAATSDAGAGVDVVVTLVTYGEPTFGAADAYLGAATIEADKAGGGTVSAAYGGAAGTEVTLTGVASGSSWLYVDDSSGGATGVFSTFSLHTLPANGTLGLPVISRPLLSAIFTKLPVPGVVDATKSQIILRFKRKGVPVAGIKPAAAVAGATLVFDNGPGVYTTDATTTGTGGMLLLLNTNVGAAVGSQVVDVVDTEADAGKGYSFTVPTAAGTASFADIELGTP
jgi:hypothetical protein